MPRSRLPALALLLAGAAVSLAPATPASGQVEISARDANLRIGGRFHFQMASTSAEGETLVPNFFVRRARIVADVSVSDFLDGRVQPSFVTGKVLLEDAWFRLKFDPAFQLSFGQFKQGFDLFELASSTELNVVERSGFIRGVNVCPGVSLLCTYGEFSARLLYGGRDTGIRLDGSFGDGRWGYIATLTNGEGIFDNADSNGRKATSARLTFSPVESLTLGASVNAHDFVVEQGDEDVNQTGYGWNLDAQWGDYRGGPLVQLGVIGGDNWKLLGDGDEPATFVAGQVIASYYHRLAEGHRLDGVEPVVRVSYGDADTASDDDNGAGWLLTPGFNLYVLGRNRINGNVDVWVPTSGDTEWSFRAMTYLYF